MQLSGLKTGEKGIIVKVSGHGGFRKRIIEMGFIRGKQVEVLLNAPLKDPVKYKIMGYEVSLRHSEANQIEVVSEDEIQHSANESYSNQESDLNSSKTSSTYIDKTNVTFTPQESTEDDGDKLLETVAERRHHVINVALVGNPNCGKTSLFNFASGA